jgi:DNA polymerase III delta prime subunit
MPVEFFPDNPIDRLEQIILKENGEPLYGEIDTYRLLFEGLKISSFNWSVWYDLTLPIHSTVFNPYQKTSSQIDFLAICEKGIVVIEVKGGEISSRNHKFYYGKSFQTSMRQNPFTQAEGYKYTLKDRLLNNFKSNYFCSVVIFPHVNYKFSNTLIKPNTLFTSFNSPEYDNSIELFLLKAISTGKSIHSDFRTFKDLSSIELEKVKRILNPIVFENSPYSTSTRNWLNLENLDILEGLEKNPRIFIEGAPGTGKTTTALAFMDRQVSKKGLYICWNNFLLIHTKNKYRQRSSNGNIEFFTYFNFIRSLNNSISTAEMGSLDSQGFDTLVKETIITLSNKDAIQRYDFIIIDEAQDIFDKGLERVLNVFTGAQNNGLKNGNSLVLYDIDQSYLYNRSEVAEIADLMQSDFAHFKLLENRRSTQNIEIQKLLSIIIDDIQELNNEETLSEFSSIQFTRVSSIRDFKRFLVKNVLTYIRSDNSSMKGYNSILLIESRLSKNYQESLNDALIINDVEMLTGSNISNGFNVLKYTSPLKYKGLEQENVVLFISDPQLSNTYEVFVGASRAINNLHICFLDESN